MPRAILPFVALIYFWGLSHASNLDSLKKHLKKSNGREQIATLIELGYQYLSVNQDSALKYSLSGLSNARRGNYKNLEGECLNNLGGVYLLKADYAKALDYYIEAEKLFESERNMKGRCQTAINIGVVYESQGLIEKAKMQYNQALNYSEQVGEKNYKAEALSHLASISYNEKNKDLAQDYFRRSLKLYEENNNIPRVMECLNNIAVIYQEMGKYTEALENFNTDLDYARKMGIKVDILAILHNIGLVYKDKKDYLSAIAYIDSSIYIAKDIRDFNNLREAYSTLSEIYKEQNNFSKALEYFELSSAAKDSLLSQTREKQFIEMSTKYETEKKETENKYLKSEGEKQKTILIATTGGLLLTAALAFFVYTGYRQKKKANILLASQNTEIKNQKQIIEGKQTEILDSITYAKRLQDAILPPLNFLEKQLNIFVYYQPKDIVAGDFYWMEIASSQLGVGSSEKSSQSMAYSVPATPNAELSTNNCILVAAADCTGHGVPGAMVSVVCCNALNRAVNEFGFTDPGQILDKTRELVLSTFAKSEKNVKDGMDISLCAIQKANDKIIMKWAGANNPVYIISNGQLSEVKGDKFPVGAFVDDGIRNFNTHEIELKKGDRVYIFSDGLPDQFGGPKNKKYKYKRLQEKLLESSNMSITQQKQFMQNDLMAWKGSHEQVDDVLLMGFEV